MLNHIGITVKVFANGTGDRDSISGRVIPKTQKIELDATLFNTQYYKWSSPLKGVLPLRHLGVLAIDCGRPTYIYIYIYIYEEHSLETYRMHLVYSLLIFFINK